MKKLVSIMLILAMLLGTLCACGNTETAQKEETFEKVLRTTDTEKTENFSPFLNNTNMCDYVQAKLYSEFPSSADKTFILRCDMAEKEPYTKDGDDYTWYIELRKDLKWSNGEAITADDFMYSWKVALEPSLIKTYSSGSSLASNVITVKNAVEYYKQAVADTTVKWEDVGFKKIDDYTLAVTTDKRYSKYEVMSHFKMRYTSLVYKPLYEAGMNAERTTTTYATSTDTFMSCGPFVLASWTKGAERIYEKNVNYCHADDVKVDKLVVRVVEDDATAMELFKAGEVDFFKLGTSSYPTYAEDPRTRTISGFNVRELEINFKNPDKPYLDNVNFRKALYYAVDRNTIAKLTNFIAAPYFLSKGYSMTSDGKKVREYADAKGYVPVNGGYDEKLAKEYFDKAMKELNWKDPITINITYWDSSSEMKVASEYLQSQWQKIFGEDRFKVTLNTMSNTAIASMMKTAIAGPTNEWDLGWYGWNLTAARVSANIKFNRYTSDSTTAVNLYHNDFIDEAFAKSQTEEYRLDEKKLLELTLDMEKSYLDHVDAIPVFEQVNYVIYSDRIIQPTVDEASAELYYSSYFDLAYDSAK